MKGYCSSETVKQVDEALRHVDHLYNCNCVKWKGRTTDTGEYYCEIIARELLKPEKYGLLGEIKLISRPRGVKPRQKEEVNIRKNPREEENFGKWLFEIKLDKLGKIIGYQIPLKGKQSDKAGKIDLIADSDGSICLVELKYLDNQETLLRAVLEIWTYYKQLDRRSLDAFVKCWDRKSPHVGRAVLLGEGSNAHKEATQLDDRPELKKLIQKLGVRVLFFKYDVTELVLSP